MNSTFRFVTRLAHNSPWFFSAILIHVIIGFGLAIVYVKQALEHKDEKIMEMSVSATGKAAEEPVVLPPEPIDRKAIPKNVQSELVSFKEDIYTPIDDEPFEEDLTLNVGDPNAAEDLPPGATGGTSIGAGIGPGHGPSGGPSTIVGRRAGGGGKGHIRHGATQGTEESVLGGLTWLVRHQSPDGAWHAASLREVCVNKERPCLPADVEPLPYFDEGLTGLALLAFLGSGFAHDAKTTIDDQVGAKRYVIGDVVKSGLKWLRDRQKPDGSFSSAKTFLYNEALAAMAMCEAYALSQNRYWREPAERAVQFLIDAQKISPRDGSLWGWRYGSLKDARARKEAGEIGDGEFQSEAYDADISVTCVVVMALKSARLSGLEVPEEVFEGAVRFAEYVTGHEGLVGYQLAEQAGRPLGGVGGQFTYHPTTMSALGMLVRTFVRRDLTDPFFELAAHQIVKDLPMVTDDRRSVDYYNWYYATLALHQFDGPDSPREAREGKKGAYWDPWNRAMIKALTELQDDSKGRDACSRGGWLQGDRWALQGGPIYSTALNTLTLEVYYRFENAFGTAARESLAKVRVTTPEEINPAGVEREER